MNSHKNKHLFITILLLFISFEIFSQTEKISKWSGEISAGLGFAELRSENFEISGHFTNIGMLVSYKPSNKMKVLGGIGISKFSNGNMHETGFSSTKATFLDIPLKMRFVEIKSETLKTKLFFGIGFQASTPILYELKTEKGTAKINSNLWYFSMPLEVGIEFPLNDTYEFGIYYEGNISERKTKKNFLLKDQNFLKLSLICNF